ncbi:MAG TPA: thiol-disulfide oxidoreductase DCC family protein [Blastocatellia bacterium]|nr:thiol-disulfide oxidoreductase DCC family protein [Blastocatellia bacterium]
MSDSNSEDMVLLYDGVCGFCNRSVQFIIARDRRGTMKFAALQSEYGKAIKSSHPGLDGIDSLVLVKRAADGEQRVFVRSDAALQVASYLGGFWKLLLVLYIVPAPVRDFFYSLFAKYRYRLFGKHDSCLLPAPSVRSRFIDSG